MDTERYALISGGMGEVGRAVAERLARDGYSIALLTHTTSDDETRKFLSGLAGNGHRHLRCDLADPTSIPDAVQSLLGDSTVAICVHAATPHVNRVNLMDETVDGLEAQLHIQTIGSFVLLQEIAKRIRRSRTGGRIVGITTAGLDPHLHARRMGSYLVAKAAFVGILRELAKELAADGITVNAVAPGYMAGGLNKDLPERLADFAKESNPMKLTVTAADVAGAVAFLCSPDAHAITGCVLPVTGGEMLTL